MEPRKDTPRPAIVILAAGKGTRMKSDLPKVLHPLGGKPLLAYPLELAKELEADRVVVVVGHQAQKVQDTFAAWPGLSFALQEPQLGTGHAVQAAAHLLAGHDGPVLILYGDVPGLTAATLRALLDRNQSQGEALTVLAMDLPDPGHYGRLVSGPAGGLARIVEYRDASEGERAITLVNSGIYVIQAQPLQAYLPRLAADNDQKEYYLTDLVELMANDGLKVGYSVCSNPLEVAGVNSKAELEELEEKLGEKKS